jgi:hypothetical protein
MKVRELIDILEELDPEANVLLMSQRHWPFENAIYGVTTRAEIDSERRQDDESVTSEDENPTDVFIVEGDQLRYGNQSAWEAAVRS